MMKSQYERKVLEDAISLKKMRTSLHFSFESLAVHGGEEVSCSHSQVSELS